MNLRKEVIQRSDSGTLHYMDGHRRKPSLASTFENISVLIADLESRDEADGAEFDFLHSNVDKLLNKVSGRQLDLLGDLNGVVESFRKGFMTPEQLETMIRAEQERSQYILNLSTIIGGHMSDLCNLVESMLSSSENGVPVSKSVVHNVNTTMTVMSEVVDSIPRLVNTPAHQLQSTITEIGQEIGAHLDSVPKQKKEGKKESRKSEASHAGAPRPHPSDPPGHLTSNPSHKSMPRNQLPVNEPVRPVPVKVDKDCQTDPMPSTDFSRHDLLRSSDSRSTITVSFSS